MLTPDYLITIADGATEQAAQLHDWIINAILKRVIARYEKTGDIVFSATDKWQLETLQQAGELMKELRKEIAKKTGAEAKEISKALKDAGVETLTQDAKFYRAAGINGSIGLSPEMTRIIARQYETTMGLWNNYTATTAESVQKTFIDECDLAYRLMQSGGYDYATAVAGAVRRIAGDGLKTVKYPSGHEDTIEVATLRAVRTAAGQTAGQITATRAAEYGITLFMTSAHIGARPTHFPWQGKVFWVDWRRFPYPISETYQEAPEEYRERYPEFCETTQIGSVTGLCGVNCRHSFMPYIEGVSYNPNKDYDSEENAKRYAETQRQRMMERKIRKQKRELQGFELGLPECQEDYDKTLAKLRKMTAAYYQYCRDTGLKPREISLYTGGQANRP